MKKPSIGQPVSNIVKLTTILILLAVTMLLAGIFTGQATVADIVVCSGFIALWIQSIDTTITEHKENP